MSDIARTNMVAQQLAARGILDRRVLEAMEHVPRDRFVPASRREAAYDDRALPLHEGQTISQPYMVARTLELARIGPDARVLDVGTGSGYQAAVCAELAAEVVSIERIPALAEDAAATLSELGYDDRVVVVVGDGSLGWPLRAPYDAIVAAAAAPRVPESLKRQLAIGGRLVLPVGSRGAQLLTVVIRRGEDDFEETTREACVYVPLVGAEGWKSG